MLFIALLNINTDKHDQVLYWGWQYIKLSVYLASAVSSWWGLFAGI